jgi:methionine aminotransferase
VGLARFLTNADTYLSLSAFLQKKRDLFARLMTATKFTPLPSFGSYFQLYKYDRISDEPDKDFAIRITKEYGVATIPVSVFYTAGKDDRVVRFCFAKKEETLEKAAERLVKI